MDAPLRTLEEKVRNAQLSTIWSNWEGSVLRMDLLIYYWKWLDLTKANHYPKLKPSPKVLCNKKMASSLKSYHPNI